LVDLVFVLLNNASDGRFLNDLRLADDLVSINVVFKKQLRLRRLRFLLLDFSLEFAEHVLGG